MHIATMAGPQTLAMAVNIEYSKPREVAAVAGGRPSPQAACPEPRVRSLEHTLSQNFDRHQDRKKGGAGGSSPWT